MKTLKVLALVLLALIVFTLPVFVQAQGDEGALVPGIAFPTEEVTTVAPVDPVAPPAVASPDPNNLSWVLIILVVVLALFAVYMLVLRPVLIELGKSVPLVALDSVIAGQERAFKQGVDWAAKTPTKVDDYMVKEFRASIRADINEVLRARGLPEMPPLPE